MWTSSSFVWRKRFGCLCLFVFQLGYFIYFLLLLSCGSFSVNVGCSVCVVSSDFACWSSSRVGVGVGPNSLNLGLGLGFNPTLTPGCGVGVGEAPTPEPGVGVGIEPQPQPRGPELGLGKLQPQLEVGVGFNCCLEPRGCNNVQPEPTHPLRSMLLSLKTTTLVLSLLRGGNPFCLLFTIAGWNLLLQWQYESVFIVLHACTVFKN